MPEKRSHRNAPCPCGSGKKYKNCCLGKGFEKAGAEQGSEERGPEPDDLLLKRQPPVKYPIGTIAYYGPDDKTTTKIAAGVFKFPNSKAIIRRWVASDVATNPRIQAQMLEFFKEHGVTSVAMSEGIMGCPHEEGEDFPEGEDCPFCPFWKGKQGSNRRS